MGRKPSSILAERSVRLSSAFDCASVSACPAFSRNPMSASLSESLAECVGARGEALSHIRPAQRDAVLDLAGKALLVGQLPASERAEGRPAVHGAEADDKTQRQRADKRHHKQLQRVYEALVKGGYYGLEFGHKALYLSRRAKSRERFCALCFGEF